jgi:hypothetical protein
MAHPPAEQRAQTRYGVHIERAALAFDSLPFEAQQILRLCDGHRSLRRIRHDSPIDRARTERVLRRLATLGLITDLAWASRRDDRPAAEVPLPLAGRPLVQPGPELPAPAPELPAPGPELLAPASPVGETTLVVVDPALFVDPAPRTQAPRSVEPSFSAEEEAFFASSIEHLVD